MYGGLATTETLVSRSVRWMTWDMRSASKRPGPTRLQYMNYGSGSENWRLHHL